MVLVALAMRAPDDTRKKELGIAVTAAVLGLVHLVVRSGLVL